MHKNKLKKIIILDGSKKKIQLSNNKQKYFQKYSIRRRERTSTTGVQHK
jgi:hypothetical protein